MKLAQALMLRADYQNKIHELKNRIINNVKVQEGEDVAENPIKLLEELNKTVDELEQLIKRINSTNSNTIFEKDITLSDVICTRDSIKRKRNILVSVLDEATIRHDRYSQSEVKFVTTVKIPKLQKELDSLAKEYRELDIKIQEKNWTTELK
ncbi:MULTISPECIES: DIP1984 family protein [Clostridia]|uniref:DIP1984 family protein n=1 Tax=Clostridium sp. CCUG 7971 TaxID=2811414 RepID=UPI001ABA276D|nr:DIP1984 family protein [Clostridium sp. CCUG 7971]MBO3443362.1 DIP1984 family protein [Clostridium sp. CCUG 7971]